jgi:ATP-dependent RNA helicase RhlE
MHSVSESPFAALGVSPQLCAAVIRAGYSTPTPIQSAAIPAVLRGADVVARAQTGTGKTAAFGLPMIDRLSSRPKRDPRAPRALVLVPTRELAAQVERAIRDFSQGANLRTAVIFGGAPIKRQIAMLSSGIDILVATPGRLIDHMQRRTVSLGSIEILVLDEADRMLDIGFLPALKRLLPALPRERQTLLFSATLPAAVVSLAASMTRNPIQVNVSPGVVASTVKHQCHRVADHQKADLLARLLKTAPTGQALVFCKTKRRSDRVGKNLERAGVPNVVIHGNKSQSARTRALDSFRTGRARVLVATDIAARGLDIAELPLVVNYDLPMVAEDYIHRIGRTGRAGRSGRALSLISGGDHDLLRSIERLLPSKIEQIEL